MRLLILGPNITDVSATRNFTGVWSHFLSKEFRSAGVELIFDQQIRGKFTAAELVRHYAMLDLSAVDHVLAFGLGYLDRLPEECIADLKRRCRGLVAQTHDRPNKGSQASLTFGIRRAPPDTPHYVQIGWAADPDLCRPRQSKDRRVILIDHPDYGLDRRNTDRTTSITAQALIFANHHREFIVRRIADNGVQPAAYGTPSYKREHVPYTVMCEEYGKADVFMVTHPESVGLTALECAMAGALVVSPKGYIGADLISTIRHISFERDVPWTTVMRDIDAGASRSAAMANSWSLVASKILTGLGR